MRRIVAIVPVNEELWIEDAAEIRTKRVRKQKTDRQDAQLILKLMLEDRFPRIWVPSSESRDLRQLLGHRHPLGSKNDNSHISTLSAKTSDFIWPPRLSFVKVTRSENHAANSNWNYCRFVGVSSLIQLCPATRARLR